ncbi:MAG: SNF2 family DNA or RNA helicase [Verrucomicrobiales bacterium]|jgi:SNF2 family DNA or RNA helicase
MYVDASSLPETRKIAAQMRSMSWENSFYGPYLERGLRYHKQGRVQIISSSFLPDGWMVLAEVEGTQLYRTEVFLNGKQLTDIFGTADEVGCDCSCPVGPGCKHCAALGYELVALAFAAKVSAAPAPPKLPAQLVSWLAAIKKNQKPAEIRKPNKKPTNALRQAFFSLQLSADMSVETGGLVRLVVLLAQKRKDGIWVKITRPDLRQMTYGRGPATLTERQRERLDEFGSIGNEYETLRNEGTPMMGRFWSQLIGELIPEGLVWEEQLDHPLVEGPEIAIRPGWIQTSSGNLQTCVFAEDDPATPLAIIPASPPWYVRSAKHMIGQAKYPEDAQPLLQWLGAPEISAMHADNIRQQLPASLQPPGFAFDRRTDVKPRGHVRLASEEFRVAGPNGIEMSPVNFAEINVEYDGEVVPYHDQKISISRRKDDGIEEIQRNGVLEAKLMDEFTDLGFMPIQLMRGFYQSSPPQNYFVLPSVADWIDFLSQILPMLRADGWTIETDDSFQHTVVEPDEWYADLSENSSGIDWFDFDYGMEIDGKRVSLLAAITSGLRRIGPNGDLSMFTEATEDEKVLVYVEELDAWIAMPAKRIASLINVLAEILDHQSDEPITLHSLQAAQLEIPEFRENEVPTALRQLRKNLESFESIPEVAPCSLLRAELRDYQREGLSWIQFVRSIRLGGILADDMGLGKTIQTIAAILTEHQQGRRGRPSLIVAPTSVLGNWVAEIERFAPEMRSLLLHGPERKKRFDQIVHHDFVITSYALLPRDADVLTKTPWHYVILDEAQMIKNPNSRMAQVACELEANHRLCLTGTPIENHLGELWSLFHFLAPGFLGDERRFRKLFRNPIEKQGNRERQQLLVRRVRPLILRRTREDVLTELPPLTEIQRTIPFEKAQSELYELVRVGMNKRIRDQIAEKGLARSHITILDALLKLRQICCHPRLLKTDSARKIDQSAKLDHFRELITGLVGENRRVLVFSQFTTMLSIIEEELKALSIPFVKLTGKTRKRDEVIRRFQGGEVPVFLISLKAGGTGLNLTTADTVIHYDPWWNPAVENQATGRAHRMGQTKPVFVYRLVTEGTIEERILQLQERKAELARSVLDPDGEASSSALGKEDLEFLLAPIS